MTEGIRVTWVDGVKLYNNKWYDDSRWQPCMHPWGEGWRRSSTRGPSAKAYPWSRVGVSARCWVILDLEKVPGWLEWLSLSFGSQLVRLSPPSMFPLSGPRSWPGSAALWRSGSCSVLAVSLPSKNQGKWTMFWQDYISMFSRTNDHDYWYRGKRKRINSA
jgi:hypothetical protein